MVNVEQYFPMASKLAGQFSNRADYDDLYQEACMAIVIAAKKFDPNHGAKESTFIYSSIYWACWNFVNPGKRRRRARKGDFRREVNSDFPVSHVYHHTEFDLVDAQDEIEHLRSSPVLCRLSEVDAEVFCLYREGKTFKEIGETFGKTKQWAHKRYKTAVALADAA